MINQSAKGRDLSEDFKLIVLAIQQAKRQALSAKIQALQRHFDITDDLVGDQRKLRSQETNPAGIKFRQSVAKNREENRVYKVEFDNCEPMMCNLAEAAKWAKKKESSLSVYLSKGRGRVCFIVENESLKVTKTDFLEPK